MSEDARPQTEKFKELARQLEVDESEAHFEDQVRKIAKKGGGPAEAEPPKSQD